MSYLISLRLGLPIPCDISNYCNAIPVTPWGERVDRTYRLFARKMLNQSGERTLICSIAPAGTTHINGIIGFVFKNDGDMFPFNLLNYVQNNLTHLLNSFIQLFVQYLDDTAKQELRDFAQGDRLKKSPMHMSILESFQALKKQRDSLSGSIAQLKDMVKDLENKPKDSSYEDEIKELKAEEAALINVLKELNKKDVFNFLSDEGLLPNYAFPEAGIILKAILYRKDEAEPSEEDAKKKYKKSVYEYSRSASAAISEFAPNNSFYVEGRKLTIDQIDLTSSQSTKWRLCPNCSHGTAPEIMNAANANEEFDFILEKVKGLIDEGVSAKNICIVARTHKLLDDYITHFTSCVTSYQLKKSSSSSTLKSSSALDLPPRGSPSRIF